MNSISINVTTSSKTADGLLTDRQYLIAEGLLCLIRGTVSILGIIGNIINIVTYISMRPNDSVTVSFLVLAFSDLAYLVAMASRSVSFGFHFAEKMFNMTVWFPVEPYGVYIFFGNAGSIPYTFSILITSLLAVASTYIPVLVFMGMTEQFNAEINTTRSTLWISPRREEIKVILWAVRDAMLPVATQVTVFACVLVMARSLRRSVAFRQSTIKSNVGAESTNKDALKKSNRGNDKSVKLTGKELQAIQQVLCLSLLFIVCNTPKILVNFTPFFVHDFALGQPNQNLYLTSIGFLYLFQIINSSSSVLIYYNFSSKYRKHSNLCL
ncbi:hypothetical protein Btru_005553 [Bulinus truncatus]|nr:hypothetical protein Btru_005553 [Bulinus truncatus]